ncbi:hypothetical protein AGMMS49579_01640 [Spirochaetia bacterium]|nr:hypothetical protein AGMMS49579_01640 [Spirochaetia bacterium]
MKAVFDGALALRRRSFWEAADAGLLLWRRDFFYFLPFFAIPLWVCAFGLRMLPEVMRPWLTLMLWFFKPLFDRPVLHVIGVRFFEPRSGARRLLQGLGKSILRGLPGDLLWRRFSPWRAVMMPVRVLEGLKPAQVRQRKQRLSNGGVDFCVLITVWGYILEGILLIGEILFLFMVIELMQENYITSIFDFLEQKELFYFTAYCVNYMLVESLYVCMGFGLYINSRVEVEGWDLEVLFRSFLQKSPRPVRSGSVLVLCLFLFLLVPTDGYAQTEAADNTTVNVPLEILEDILGSKDFGGEKDGWGIRPRQQREQKPPFVFNTASWVDLIKKIFAVLLRGVLVLAIAALLFFSIIYVFRLKNRFPLPFRRRLNEQVLHTGSVSESPEQLLEQARSFHARGELREAWAACFAAALSVWSTYRRLSFPSNATEYGCLAIVRQADAVPLASAAEIAGFGELVFTWAAFAYGGKIPADGYFDKALAFCESLGAHNG